ncbi:MAG TPA: phosphatidylglycerophosphatase A [Nevskiaceae bacterium]|nr:phosphatidylglycerophosphatase A [Nevskiaceae bacterium]
MSDESEDAGAPAPPAALVLTTPEHFIAFGFGAGLARTAPGTWGTLVGVPFFLALQFLPVPAYLAACVLFFVFGCWVCGESARLLRVHDYGGIVFDEIAGFLIACVPLVRGAGLVHQWLAAWLLAAFALFRFFDIIKPWPIGWFDRRLRGGFGIMFDDALAGIFTAAWLLLLLELVRWKA